MIRKVLALLLVSVVAVTGLLGVGCSPEPEAVPPEEEAPATPPEEEEAPAAPAQETIKWKLQGHVLAADAMYEQVSRLAERITTASGGQLTVEPFPGGAIVPIGEELTEGVDKGVLEAGLSYHGYYRGVLPTAGLFAEVVGGLTPVQAMLWYSNGGGNELAAEAYEQSFNVKYINSPNTENAEVWCHSTKPLETLDDLVGTKFRTSGDGGAILAAMGVAVVSVPGSELYEAAARGVVDCFEYGTLSRNWGLGFHEVTDYIYLSPSRCPCPSAGFWVNEDAWAELTPELQAVVELACRAEPLTWYAQAIAADNAALQNYIDYGTQVVRLPQSIEDAFAEEAGKYYDEKAAVEGALYAKVLASISEYKELCELLDIR